MTPEELNRTIEFIIQSRARLAAAQEQDRVDRFQAGKERLEAQNERVQAEKELKAFDQRLASLAERLDRMLEKYTG
jgi:hypothetical protein